MLSLHPFSNEYGSLNYLHIIALCFNYILNWFVFGRGEHDCEIAVFWRFTLLFIT